jgi:hypothetical protein
MLTSPSTLEAEAPAPGCGCCKPPEPPTVDEQIAALQARRASVEERLRSLQEG